MSVERAGPNRVEPQDEEAQASEPAAAASEDAGAGAVREGARDSRMSVMSKLTAAKGGAGDTTRAGEPQLPRGKDFSGTTFKEAHGPLFTHEASPDDVGQGAIGDCFFLSSLAAVAQRRPDIVKNAVKDNGNGTYTVTFKQKQRDGSMKDVPVTVDNKLPMTGTHPQFGQGRDGTRAGPEIWPSIVEKAYAKFKGGYSTLNQGGSAKDVLEQLTGGASEHFDVSKLDEDELWKKLQDATSAGKPMVSGTTTAKGLDRATKSKDEGGFVESHDYTLLGTEERDGERYVKLRNPWASNSPHVPGVERKEDDNGVFEIPYSMYRKTFSDVAINNA